MTILVFLSWDQFATREAEFSTKTEKDPSLEMTIVFHEELLDLAGLSKKAHTSTLRRVLRKAGIPFKELNSKIFTTEEAITSSIIGNAKVSKGPNFDAIASTG